MAIRFASILAVLLVSVMLIPAIAGADGDPASDVLLGENVFYPYTPSVTAAVQRTLKHFKYLYLTTSRVTVVFSVLPPPVAVMVIV